MPTAEPSTARTAAPGHQQTGWASLYVHLHCDTATTDAFLTEDLAPLLDGLVARGEAAAWFFIRYGEGGPHLRVRVRDPHPRALRELPDALSRAAAARPATSGPWPSAHAEVREVPYVPETERYGGPPALPVAEDVFVASTRAAVAALRALAAGPRADRLTLAADAVHTTVHALGLDPLRAGRLLRAHAAGWRWITEVPLLPGRTVHARVNTVFAAQHTALRRRADALREGLDRGTAPPWQRDWAAAVTAADHRLTALHDTPLPWVWASQLHMLLNRLGVTPDEERAVCRLAARTALEPDGPGPFFTDGHDAPDRRYLEHSKYPVGALDDTAVRPGTGSAVPAPSPHEHALPHGPLPDVSLAAALTSRTSTRTRLAGPLDARTLGTLLWGALAESHVSELRLPDGDVRTTVHRPYPSAGALYTARLRLLALGVDGLPPATYEVVPERRVLRPLGPAPDREAVRALSNYFSQPADDPDGIVVDDTPALLALHLDLGVLRRRYGLRALRLGLLESGHLAQTLLLAAAALGLATVPVSGFHDDLAAELLGLDATDQPLQYLLPLGTRAPVPGAGPAQADPASGG
ncbi:thiopeptide-type bacteriocin biosynthesis protein [Streptomyces sp. NPDC090022]|uniref:thiopeptide-type bacteriocin biosynthesis protein n=1 Tax=Streptomyces sp. NPDC090022 TaxID=3365920 RepID=UPI0038174B63